MRLLRVNLVLTAMLAFIFPRGIAQTTAIDPAAKSIAMAAKLPAYDVVSIRLNKSGQENSQFNTTDDGIDVENCTLQEIVQDAYNLGNPDLISGIAGQLVSVRFDIKAKLLNHDVAAKLTDVQLQAMAIPLLADRFHLRVRLVPKKMTVYEIVVAKGGPKFKLTDAENGDDSPNMSVNFAGSDNTLTAKKATISDFADGLSQSQLHSIVVDRTGLKGTADLTLRWTSDAALEQGSQNAISIFTAIQDQLGLKLQPAKLPVDTLVIDHAEMPTEN
jgi:uncharacterized protein (TIGR03435 family)